MSEEFHRPTYTTDPEDVHSSFNATQVRLYGIPGLSDDNEERKNPIHMYTLSGDDVSAVIKLDSSELSSSTAAKLQKLLNGTRVEESKYSYVFIKAIMKTFMIMLGAVKTSEQEEEGKKSRPLTAGVIFGYAYEGHTYDLPKPKVMLIPSIPHTIPVNDSGYDRKRAAGYRVWIVDKLDQCVEIDINQGFVEQLVLEANLPGRRSPNMYVGKMLLAHRSGRLME